MAGSELEESGCLWAEVQVNKWLKLRRFGEAWGGAQDPRGQRAKDKGAGLERQVWDLKTGKKMFLEERIIRSC